VLIASSLLALLVGCGPPGDGAVACGELEPRNEKEVALCNDLGYAVIARVEVPEGDPPAGGWPGVVVLHGSSGLFNEDHQTCTQAMRRQFQHWAERLNAAGYAAIFPASFYSRGFCDSSKSADRPRDYDGSERLVTRVFDAAAAGEWLCDDPRVDCDRLALMGFSNGGTTTVLLMHEDLRDADDDRLKELVPPPFLGAVAYYPGCSLQSQLNNTIDAAAIDELYYPRAPMFVAHASRDHLSDDCRDIRDPQVRLVADDRGVSEDWFDLKIYSGAKHGFDDSESDDRADDYAASEAAKAKTLALFADWF